MKYAILYNIIDMLTKWGDTVLTENYTDYFRRIYDNSPMPAAIAADSGFIYRNKAFTELIGADASELGAMHTGSSYEKHIYSAGRLFKAYVTVLSDNESLVNISEASSFSDACFDVLEAAVRYAVSKVTSAADGLYEICGSEGAELLNVIDSSMLTLLSEFLIPEEIRILRKTQTLDFPSESVSGRLSSFGEELSELFAKQAVHVSLSIASGMFARIDMRGVVLLLTDFAVKVLEGERTVEAVSIKLTRHNAENMRLVFSCGHLMGLPSQLESESVEKPDIYSSAEELKTLLCELFGCTINVTRSAEYSSITIDIPFAEAPDFKCLRAPVKAYGRSRFSDENSFLARFGFNSRYK